MNNYKLKIDKLLYVTAFVSIIIIVGILYYKNIIEKNEILKVFGVQGSITAIIGVLWKWFKKYGWKLGVFQHFKTSLNIPPNLNGRWEGVFIRPEHVNPFKFIIEIEQTIDTIVLRTYSRRGGSSSVSSVYNLLTDELQSTFYLNYFWQAEVGKKKTKFNGYSMLKLIENKKERKLVGTYFTDREPAQTKGKTTIVWKSKQLKNEF